MEAERGQINLLKATEHFNIKVNGYLISFSWRFCSLHGKSNSSKWVYMKTRKIICMSGTQ